MKNKIFFGINIFFSTVILVNLFLPIDSAYIYAIGIVLGALISLLLLTEIFLMKDKLLFSVLFIAQIASVSIFCIMIARHYSFYRIGWKFNMCFLNFPIMAATFVLANDIFQKKRCILTLFLCLQSIIFIKSIFFAQFYYFEVWDRSEDIRTYSEKGQYKVIGRHKLKNKNPVKLTNEDHASITYLLVHSDWLKENYPDDYDDILESIDVDFIKKNITYSFSLINFGCVNVDVFALPLRLATGKQKIMVYVPKGNIIMYDKKMIDYKKYYGSLPQETEYGYYTGLDIPFSQELYPSL